VLGAQQTGYVRIGPPPTAMYRADPFFSLPASNGVCAPEHTFGPDNDRLSTSLRVLVKVANALVCCSRVRMIMRKFATRFNSMKVVAARFVVGLSLCSAPMTYVPDCVRRDSFVAGLKPRMPWADGFWCRFSFPPHRLAQLRAKTLRPTPAFALLSAEPP